MHCINMQYLRSSRHRPAIRHLCKGDVDLFLCIALRTPEPMLQFAKLTLTNFRNQPIAIEEVITTENSLCPPSSAAT